MMLIAYPCSKPVTPVYLIIIICALAQEKVDVSFHSGICTSVFQKIPKVAATITEFVKRLCTGAFSEWNSPLIIICLFNIQCSRTKTHTKNYKNKKIKISHPGKMLSIRTDFIYQSLYYVTIKSSYINI